METILLDRSVDGTKALVADRFLTDVRYVPIDEAPADYPLNRVSGSHLSQAHYCAAIKRDKAAQGLIIGAFRPTEPTDWDELGTLQAFMDSLGYSTSRKAKARKA